VLVAAQAVDRGQLGEPIRTVHCDEVCRLRQYVAQLMPALRPHSAGPARENEPLREQRSAIAEHVGALREAVVRFADASGASRRTREQIALAVSEALSNCVIHAYAGQDRPGPVTVEAWARAGSVVVLVSDEGRGMVPRLDSPGLGIGLPLIAQMSDQLDIEARDDQPGVRVRMTFAIT
jgi:serine/threonine-protein kinase RsbW/stage II sporulation protein AB (anti-sigma F factor)